MTRLTIWLALWLAILTGTGAGAPPPWPCGDGRFLRPVDAQPLVDGAPTYQALVVSGARAQLDGCKAVPLRMRRTADGRPRAVARWKRCLRQRDVVLRAVPDADCTSVAVEVRARKRPRRQMALARSTCGDGRIDARSDERCDGGTCPDGGTCTAACACPGQGACMGDGFASTWEALAQRIFVESGCTASSCHAGAEPAGGLLLDPAAAWAQLVDVASSADPAQRRVVPGDAQASLLWRKLAARTLAPGGPDVPGSPMPVGVPPVDVQRLEALRLWIRAGAPADGVVPDTAARLAGCLPPPGPTEIPPPPAPPAGEGVQFHAPPWTIAPHDEDEVCFATWIDVDAQVPDAATVPCPSAWAGPGKRCFAWSRSELVQDPNSHHSIVYAYAGGAPWSDPTWGPWTCRGGTDDGVACDPTQPGLAPPAGGACGGGGGCASRATSTVNCILFGPPDFSPSITQTAPTAPAIGGAQQPRLDTRFAAGVYDVLPTRGLVVWNSHAFDLFDVPVTNEQWINFWFADDRRFVKQPIFDVDMIFSMSVPAFGTQEICNAFTLPPHARLFELSSHTHRRGTLFRAWAPGVTDTAGTAPLLVTTDYSDPDRVWLDPPLALDSPDATARTIQFCARYDNGATNPDAVKRRSTSPEPPFGDLNPYGGPCETSQTVCLWGPHHGEPCNGSDAGCGPGGTCDACPLTGGFTTEDEMFILTGSYYVDPP